MAGQVTNWGGKRARSSPARVQENPSLEAPLQEQLVNANPNQGIRVPPSSLPRANLDTSELPNMTVMMGMMQSMAQTNGQLAQLIPTIAQSARQTTHHNRGDTNASEESKYFRAFKRRDPEVFEGKSKDPIVAELWLSAIVEIFQRMKCPEEHRLSCVTYLLREDAKLWWQSAAQAIAADEDDITWTQFRTVFSKILQTSGAIQEATRIPKHRTGKQVSKGV